MDKKIKEQIRHQIKKQLQDLSEEIKNMEERSQTVNLDEPIGRLSRMDSITNQGIALSSLNNARIRLTRLEMALKKIDEDDEFGYCDSCGEDIALKRLMALPESTLCIHCAQ